MNPTIETAKSQFMQSKEALRSSLERVPEERLDWSPSATSRTPVQQVAHAAYAIGSLHDQLRGNPFPITESEQADREFRDWEHHFSTKDAALDLLEANSAEYVAWLDTLAEHELDRMVVLPFGLGEAPLGSALNFATDHTRFHIAQMNYIQTIYGDRNWYL
jgi:hypothetical protein